MKLILAIVQDEDSVGVMDELNVNGFMVTKMCSSGGFLRAGNTTLLILFLSVSANVLLLLLNDKEAPDIKNITGISIRISDLRGSFPKFIQ